jgi:hypothetical protein
MGRGGYLGGNTIIKGGHGFTPLDYDGGYEPGPSQLTPNQFRTAARSARIIQRRQKKRKSKLIVPLRKNARMPRGPEQRTIKWLRFRGDRKSHEK